MKTFNPHDSESFVQNPTVQMVSNATLSARQAEEDARLEAETENNTPLIEGLASHVKDKWESAKAAKRDVEIRMLQALRQRRGEYDPEVLSEIEQFGGSKIFAMLTSNKCRGALSWLKDTLLGSTSSKPWGLTTTSIPELSPTDTEKVAKLAAEQAYAVEQALQAITTSEDMGEIVGRLKDREIAEATKTATEKLRRMEAKMEDQLQEGGFVREFAKFLDDFVTFPAAIFKGPVIRFRPTLKWVQKESGFEPEVQQTLVTEWERVDPFNFYPVPPASTITDGDTIERHKLSRSQLFSLIGVDGYKEDAIRAVLDQYGEDGWSDWDSIDEEKAAAEGEATTNSGKKDGLITAYQFFGTVQGKMLVDWGMEEEAVPDILQEYSCEVWVIDSWVIKAVLNHDPFGRKPYYKASYEEIPGAFWGNAVPDLIRDVQTMCNAAVRAIANNSAIASGPQVAVNIDRIPTGDSVTQMYPWKVWGFKNDPFGSNSSPIEFFQPNSNTAELMALYEKFSILADEYSGIPRYMTGDGSAGGAGRTASGLSMLMGNAGKAIKGVIDNIDRNVIVEAVERLYFHNMKYGKDPDLKGDIQIVAKGAHGLVQKDQMQVRRNEFLGIVSQNPVFLDIVGKNGVAALLRESARDLGMDVDKIVPSEDVLKIKDAQAMQQQQMMAQQQQAGVMAETKNQNLQNGAPITNNFAPQKGQ